MSGFEIFMAVMIGAQAVAGYSASKQQAKTSEQMAASELKASKEDALRYRREQSARRANARAARGASGVDFTGSPLLVDQASLLEAMMGEKSILEGGQLRAMRLRQQAGLQEQAGVMGLLEGGTEILGVVGPNIFGGEDVAPSEAFIPGSPTGGDLNDFSF